MNVLPPPQGTQLTDERGTILPGYREFFIELYKKFGSSLGDLQIVNNAIQTITDNGDVTINPDTPLVLDELTLNENLVTDYVLVCDNNGVLIPTNVLNAGLAISTGFCKFTYETSPPSGWILLNDGTIGNASSGATTRANADTEALFTLLWNNTANSECPVSSGRGASAAADFAANKTIRLPLTRGRALCNAGAGSGLTSRSLGTTTGTETHILTSSEIPAHTHDIGERSLSDILPFRASQEIIDPFPRTTDTNSTGSSVGHNNMQPTVFLNAIIKL